MIVHSPGSPLCLRSPSWLSFFCSPTGWAAEPIVAIVDGFGMLCCSGESNIAVRVQLLTGNERLLSLLPCSSNREIGHGLEREDETLSGLC